MKKKPLAELLEEDCGLKDFHLILPHPLLPPRFREKSEQRNMILLLDRELTLHVRWEGARMHEHWPLTPAEAVRLIREVLSRLTIYRQELNTFSRFVAEAAEQPFEAKRFDAYEEEVSVPSPALRTPQQVSRFFMPSRVLEMGGESPLPDGSFNE